MAESYQLLEILSAEAAGTLVDAVLALESLLAAAQYLPRTLAEIDLDFGQENLFAWGTGSQVALTPIVVPSCSTAAATKAATADDGRRS